MASKRHTQPSTRVEDDVVLDAARSCVLEVGVRRTTLSSVARAAGVSRMTLYRRFPDVSSLLAALMTREFGALLARVDRATSRARNAASLLSSSAGAAGISASVAVTGHMLLAPVKSG